MCPCATPLGISRRGTLYVICGLYEENEHPGFLGVFSSRGNKHYLTTAVTATRSNPGCRGNARVHSTTEGESQHALVLQGYLSTRGRLMKKHCLGRDTATKSKARLRLMQKLSTNQTHRSSIFASRPLVSDSPALPSSTTQTTFLGRRRGWRFRRRISHHTATAPFKERPLSALRRW